MSEWHLRRPETTGADSGVSAHFGSINAGRARVPLHDIKPSGAIDRYRQEHFQNKVMQVWASAVPDVQLALCSTVQATCAPLLLRVWLRLQRHILYFETAR